jgi:hypothetical protein
MREKRETKGSTDMDDQTKTVVNNEGEAADGQTNLSTQSTGTTTENVSSTGDTSATGSTDLGDGDN